jgi:ATP-dependent RNA helicase DeaD
VGRTGRMGREGVAYSFVTPEEGAELTRIEMRINRLLKRDDMPGISAVVKEADTSAPAMHAGPVEWRPGGWGTGNAKGAPPAGTTEPAPQAELNDAELPKEDDSPKEAAPPGKPTGKRYRRAL